VGLHKYRKEIELATDMNTSTQSPSRLPQYWTQMLSTKSMKQVDIFVPLNDNSGNLASVDKLQYIEEMVISCFGACTLHLSLVGLWVNPRGVRYQDQIMIIEVITPDQPALIQNAVHIGDMICEQFLQEEVFIVFRDVCVPSMGI
jgi:hypothetical protein